MKYELEDNVPPPKDRRGGNVVYPFGEMAVGQSFFIPCQDDQKPHLQTKLAGAARGFKLRHKTKFAIRRVVGGVRVWRVE